MDDLSSKNKRERIRKKKNQKSHYQQPKYRLSRNIRAGIYKSLRTGKAGLWEKLVGYTIAELKEHLQNKFEPGMSWENYGQWHIDHIKPVSRFDFYAYQDKDFKLCWALSNLQPLWAKDNWAKKKNRQAMRVCLDESPYEFCLDCPNTIHIKHRGRFCKRFKRIVPQWWDAKSNTMNVNYTEHL